MTKKEQEALSIRAYSLGFTTALNMIRQGCVEAGDQFKKTPWFVIVTVIQIAKGALKKTQEEFEATLER